MLWQVPLNQTIEIKEKEVLEKQPVYAGFRGQLLKSGKKFSFGKT
jgi:hypothetical protein